MEENKDIKDCIINHLLAGEGKGVTDPLLAEWLDANESNRLIFSQYEKIWKESVHYMDTEEFNTAHAWKKLDHINRRKESARKHRKNIYYVLAGAAASFLIMFALSSFMGLFDSKSDMQVSMTTDYGNRSEIVLPDGSVIRLNSGSEITYSYDKEKKAREVSFTGEGFFDISKNKDPFIITLANGLRVKVLGTSFNLCAYPDDPIIQASLLEGNIELSYEANKLLMQAGEMAAFNKETNKLQPVEGILSHSYGWLENKLYMEDMSLAEVCRYLERNYNVVISLPGELGGKIRYNGVIKEETITDVMDALSRLSNIRYTMKGRNISITPK